jgi:hypothetical protein
LNLVHLPYGDVFHLNPGIRDLYINVHIFSIHSI